MLACLTADALLFVVTFFPVEFLLLFPTLSPTWLTEVPLVDAFEVTTDDTAGRFPKWLVTDVLDMMPWLEVVAQLWPLQVAGVMTVVHCVLVTVTDDEKMIPEQDFTGAAVPKYRPWSGLSATAAEC